MVIIGTANDNSDEIIGLVIFKPMNPNHTAKNIIIDIKTTNIILLVLFLITSIITF